MYNWKLGETVTLQRMDRPLKKRAMSTYTQFVGSRYVCVREAKDGKKGVLLKVLGKAPAEVISLVDGKTFCKDERETLFDGAQSYFSYPFPSSEQVHEIIEILRADSDLLQKLEEAKMHVNPESTFWVSETDTKYKFLKRPKYYSGRDRKLYPLTNDIVCYRISIVYFDRDSVFW